VNYVVGTIFFTCCRLQHSVLRRIYILLAGREGLYTEGKGSTGYLGLAIAIIGKIAGCETQGQVLPFTFSTAIAVCIENRLPCKLFMHAFSISGMTSC